MWNPFSFGGGKSHHMVPPRLDKIRPAFTRRSRSSAVLTNILYCVSSLRAECRGARLVPSIAYCMYDMQSTVIGCCAGPRTLFALRGGFGAPRHDSGSFLLRLLVALVLIYLPFRYFRFGSVGRGSISTSVPGYHTWYRTAVIVELFQAPRHWFVHKCGAPAEPRRETPEARAPTAQFGPII